MTADAVMFAVGYSNIDYTPPPVMRRNNADHDLVPLAKRRRLDAFSFEGSVVYTIAERLTTHFQTLVDPTYVKNVCDNVLGLGWSVGVASRAVPQDQEHFVVELSGFFVAYGPKLLDFSPEEQRRDLWPLYLTLGAQLAHSYMQVLSTAEVRFYFAPLHQLVSSEELANILSMVDARQEIIDLGGFLQDFAHSGRLADGMGPPQCTTTHATDEEQRSACLLYMRLRRSEDVRMHFRVKTVDDALVRHIFATLSERDMRKLASGKAPARAVLSRYDARKQVQDYKSQSDAAARGPRIQWC